MINDKSDPGAGNPDHAPACPYYSREAAKGNANLDCNCTGPQGASAEPRPTPLSCLVLWEGDHPCPVVLPGWADAGEHNRRTRPEYRWVMFGDFAHLNFPSLRGSEGGTTGDKP